MGFTWIAPHGMVNLQKARTVSMVGRSGGLDTPHLAAGRPGPRDRPPVLGATCSDPTHTRDFWIAETFAEVYACLYVGAAFGHRRSSWCAWSSYREKLGEPCRAACRARWCGPTTTAAFEGAIVYNYGPYVFHAMLRPRIGDEAFFSALDVMLRDNYEQTISTEMLETYLEAAHGESLDDFFEFWVHSGFLPELELRWSESAGTITGTITSSVPFGTFDVPVAVTSKSDEPEVVWVDVVDGEGSFSVPYKGSAKKLKVELDPDGRVLALARKVRRE